MRSTWCWLTDRQRMANLTALMLCTPWASRACGKSSKLSKRKSGRSFTSEANSWCWGIRGSLERWGPDRMGNRTLVIIPTYNEKDNMRGIVEAVLTQAPTVDVLVVDDNSPDGTALIVE